MTVLTQQDIDMYHKGWIEYAPDGSSRYTDKYYQDNQIDPETGLSTNPYDVQQRESIGNFLSGTDPSSVSWRSPFSQEAELPVGWDSGMTDEQGQYGPYPGAYGNTFTEESATTPTGFNHGPDISRHTTGGAVGDTTGGAVDPGWQAFVDYATGLGLDVSSLDPNNLPSTLPTSFWSDLYGGGTPTADQIREDLIMDPSYQFRFGEGQRAVERRQNAMGNRFSGGGLAELTKYGQDMATQEYSNAYNRLAGITGMGATTAANQGSQAGGYGNTISGLYGDMGAAQGSSLWGQGLIQSKAASAAGASGYEGWNQLGNMWNNYWNQS